MLTIKAGSCIIYQFESLKAPGIIQGVFSRTGGVSQGPWASLNLGGTVGDDPDAVERNLEIVVSTLGYTTDHLVQVRQIHSSTVILAERPMDAEFKGDGIATDQPGLALLMRFADCVPLLYFDPVNQAVAIAHAGWKGTLANVAGQVVRKMSQAFNSRPEDLLVGIGPSIGPDHYQIGTDVERQVRNLYPEDLKKLLIEEDGKVKLDLWSANQLNLTKAGVKSIEVSGICTACNLDHWFSHRGENGATGRFGAVIGIK